MKSEDFNDDTEEPHIDESSLETRPETDLGNEAKYTGQWKGNVRYGKGKEVLSDGTVYEGGFYDDQKRG